MLFGIIWLIVAFVAGIAADQAATRAGVPVKIWLVAKWYKTWEWVKDKFKSETKQ